MNFFRCYENSNNLIVLFLQTVNKRCLQVLELVQSLSKVHMEDQGEEDEQKAVSDKETSGQQVFGVTSPVAQLWCDTIVLYSHFLSNCLILVVAMGHPLPMGPPPNLPPLQQQQQQPYNSQQHF